MGESTHLPSPSLSNPDPPSLSQLLVQPATKDAISATIHMKHTLLLRLPSGSCPKTNKRTKQGLLLAHIAKPTAIWIPSLLHYCTPFPANQLMAPEKLAAILLVSWTTSYSAPSVHSSWWAQMNCTNTCATSQWYCRLSWCALHCQLPAALWETATAAELNQVMWWVTSGSLAKHETTIQHT